MSAESTPISQETSANLLTSPALPVWYNAYKYGNRHHPQTVYGIATFLGKEVTTSLKSGAIDLSYAVCSELTPEQFNDLTEATVNAHHAHGITAMPSGHAQTGETVFDTDFWFNGTWTDMKRTFVRTLAYMAASTHPYDIDKQVDNLPLEIRNQNLEVEWKIRNEYLNVSAANKLADSIKRERDTTKGTYIQALIEDFQQSHEYEITLPLVANLYEVAAHALETDEARELARRRRDTFNRRKPSDIDYSPTANDFELQIIKLMKNELDASLVMEDNTGVNVYDFISAVSNIPRAVLKERLPYTIPETRR